MSKKNKSNNQNSRGTNKGDMLSQLNAYSAQAGFAGPTPQKEEQEENKYKDYDPKKEQRKKKSQGGYQNSSGKQSGNGSRRNDSRGKSNGNGNYGKRKIAKVKKLPVEEGPFAPYNFVPVYEKVMEDPAQANHAQISDDLYTGSLSYTILAQTPILVDSGKNKFYRNREDVPTIPGSTMRGLIRSNAQMLSFSSVRGDIDDYNLMYRAVAGGCLKDTYGEILGQKPLEVNGNQMTVLRNVNAGYIECKNGNYTIYQPLNDPDISKDNGALGYYVLNERYVLKENVRDNFHDILDKLQHDKNTKFTMREDKRGKAHYRGTQRKDYHPYYEKITYDTWNGRVSGIAKTGNPKSGYVLSTGIMQEKKAFYVIPDVDRSREVPVSKKKMQEAVTAFRIDYNRKRNILKKDVMKSESGYKIEFFDLPKEGEIRPVFYIELGDRFYFGYTPRLRLMYDHTILDGLKQDEEIMDFARSMFGYSDKNESWKSKVFFTDAVLIGSVKSAEKRELILSEPKPTSYLEYIEQKQGEEVKTYNSEDFKLRGMKQYWLQEDVNSGAPSDKEKVKSEINPLEKGSSFCGEIRFHNLTKEELGLLIWSIRLEKDSQMNIGKAKPYGYGRIKASDIELKLQNYTSSYELSSAALSGNLYEKKMEKERDSYVLCYKKYLATWLEFMKHGAKLQAEDWDEEKMTDYLKKDPTISDFLFMKSYITNKDEAGYMPLGDTRNPGRDFATFNQGNNPLPTVQYIYEKCKKGRA